LSASRYSLRISWVVLWRMKHDVLPLFHFKDSVT
jgi:hypothetical protein